MWDWRDGFHCEEGTAWNMWRWSKPHSILEITNPSDEPRSITLHAHILTALEERSHLHIHSALFAEDVEINKVGTPWEHEILLPPGTHRLEFTCDGPCAFDDKGALSFRLLNFYIAEFRVPFKLH